MHRVNLVIMLIAASLPGMEDGIGYFVNTDGTFGLTLREEPTLKAWEASWPQPGAEFSLVHALDVVLGSKSESLPNHAYAAVSAKADLLDWPFTDWDFDALLPGVGVEATQDMRSVNWTLSAHATLYNMYVLGFIYDALYHGDTTDAPSLRPSSLGLGYSYVGDWRGADTLGPGWRHRLDGRLFLTVPMTKNLSLGLLARAFNQPEDAFDFSTWKYMAEPVVTFKWKGTWMHVKYEHGALPPLYQAVDNWTIGLGFAFH